VTARQHDAIVIGAGVIGLASATAIASRGLSVLIIGQSRPGEASPASAGMLAPSVERVSGPAHNFAIAARNRYTMYVEELAEITGIRVPLNRLGILQVAITESGVRGLRKTASLESEWIDRSALTVMEPTLGHALGALLSPDDGAIDNIALLRALDALGATLPTLSRMSAAAESVDATDGNVRVRLADGGVEEGGCAVVATGAWAGSLRGASGASAVQPVRGQLISFTGLGLRHVVYGPRGYLVPRGSSETIAGSTMEQAGFDAVTTEEGIAKVHAAAAEIAPALSVAPMTSAWAGLRPVTPDLLPIIGRDPDHDRLIYACGHSRNGILLAALTGDVVAALVAGEPVAYDLSQFRPSRF
jgi:glycine oxidase